MSSDMNLWEICSVINLSERAREQAFLPEASRGGEGAGGQWQLSFSLSPGRDEWQGNAPTPSPDQDHPSLLKVHLATYVLLVPRGNWAVRIWPHTFHSAWWTPVCARQWGGRHGGSNSLTPPMIRRCWAAGKCFPWVLQTQVTDTSMNYKMFYFSWLIRNWTYHKVLYLLVQLKAK